MSRTLSLPKMAKPKRNDVPVKIDAKVYRKARTVAAWEGVDLAEYLSKTLEPQIDKDIIRMNKETSQEIGKKPHTPKNEESSS